MSVYHRSTAKSRILQEYREREQEIAAALSSQMSPKQGLEQLQSERKIRREIANSNERRRMQSINAGFQLLRSLIPNSEGEKLSKAAILQQTTEFIKTLMHDKAKILEQNAYYRKLLTEVSRRCNLEFDLDVSLYGGSPPRKRKKRDTESSDEGIAADFEDLKYDEFKRELSELRQQLDKERHLRLILENRSPHALDMHQYAEKVYQVEHHLKMQPETEKFPVDEVKQEMTVTYTSVEEVKRDQEEPLSFTPLRIDLDQDCRVPSASPNRSDSSDSGTMSRRKLETLVEAIQYVEGDEKNMDQRYSRCVNNHSYNLSLSQTISVPNSEESEKDSSIISDQDDIRSESSGRDSPTLHQQYHRLHSAQNLQYVSNVPKHSIHSGPVVSSSSYMDKYPAVTNVLQGNTSQPPFLYRPAVIVHKS